LGFDDQDSVKELEVDASKEKEKPAILGSRAVE
jgi:hypothetical protein